MCDDDVVASELEFLRASYTHDELQITSTSEDEPPELCFHARPYVAAISAHIFTALTLHITLPAAYPSQPATFRMSASRGLDDNELRQLRDRLAADAAMAAAAGDVHASQAISAAQDFLTARNTPNRCPVCFEAIDPEAVGDQALLRLEPCFHAIHLACYESYASVLAARREEKERTLRQREGPARAKRLAAVNWATCPICRREFNYDLASSQATTARMRMQILNK